MRRSIPVEADRVIFIHIPKAAGQTLHSIVARQYSPSQIVAVQGRLGHTAPLSVEQAAQAKMIIGLVHYGLHEQLPGASTYATVLREPVRRVISLYRYILSTPSHHLHEEVTADGLVGFVSREEDEEIENGQTRQIAGVPEGSLDGASLARAKQNLVDSFCTAGLVERFDESILLLKRQLSWTMPFYVQKNVNKEQLGDEVTDETLEIIRARNVLDSELYDFARDLFQEEVSREGALFEAEVSLFRTLNRAARLYRAGRELARKGLTDSRLGSR